MPFYYYHHDFSPFGPVVSVLFWILVILLVVKFIRRGKPNWHSFGGNNAIEILRERYAKGEIDKEEYEEKKSVLEK